MSGEDLQDRLQLLVVRSYQQQDQSTVAELFTEGLLAGQIPLNDTGSDLENIQEAYLSDEANHFWVAELEGQPKGMVGVLRSGEHTAEIRRLRVEKPWQDKPVAGRLVEKAVEHCRHHGYLKIVFNTRFDPDNDASSVVKLLDRFGFQHTRTKNVRGKDLMEFYLDLYRQPSSDPDQDKEGVA